MGVSGTWHGRYPGQTNSGRGRGCFLLGPLGRLLAFFGALLRLHQDGWRLGPFDAPVGIEDVHPAGVGLFADEFFGVFLVTQHRGHAHDQPGAPGVADGIQGFSTQAVVEDIGNALLLDVLGHARAHQHPLVARSKRAQETAGVLPLLFGIEGDLGETTALLRKKVAYLIEREQQALASLKRLSPGIAVAGWQEEVAEFAKRESAKGEEAIRVCARGRDWAELPEASKREQDEWEEKAATMVPRRLYRGPVSLRPYLNQLSEEERERWWQMRQEHKKGFFTLPALAVYRADGKRSLLEIADLIELETGQRDVELLVEYFQTLAKLNLVELETNIQYPISNTQ